MASEGPRGDGRGLRLGVLGVVALTLFVTLFARLWYLSAIAPERADAQDVGSTRLRRVQVEPMRGRILDRNGYVLADNRRVLSVTVDRELIRDDDDRTVLFERLAGALSTTPDELEARYASPEYDPFMPLPLAEDVPETTAVFLEERGEDYPGVAVQEGWQRVYRYAPLASHVLGYMGAIPKEDASAYLATGYRLSDRVGRAGIEQQYESALRGTPGEVVYEVDARNRIIAESSRVDPVPGDDVVLALDLPLQQHTEQLLQRGLQLARTRQPRIREGQASAGGTFPAPAGAVVVEEPGSGYVLAMASYPTFDNRWFVEGISDAKINELYPNADKSAPFVNRALSGQFQMGSTFKLVTSVAGLANGVIGPWEQFEDRGEYEIPDCNKAAQRCVFTNAGGASTKYGTVDLQKALTVSVDTYFYRIGVELHRRDREGELLQGVARAFGYGDETGIDLPGEYGGVVPDADAKKELAQRGAISEDEGRGYYVGDNLQLAIGQGLLSATPLQLTTAYATFANGGTRYAPRLALGLAKPGTPDLGPGRVDMGKVDYDRVFFPKVESTVAIAPEWWERINAGFTGVTQAVGGRRGTATAAFQGYPFDVLPVVGKTGTAQSGDKDPLKDDSLFAGYGPVGNGESPRYTVGVVAQDAGFGAWTAAPIAKCVFMALADPARVQPVAQSDPLDRTTTRPTPIAPLGDDSCFAGGADATAQRD